MRLFLRPKVFLVVFLVLRLKCAFHYTVRLNYINEDYGSIIPQNSDRPLFNEILVKFTYLVGMIANQNFYNICVMGFYPIATAYD